MDEKKEIRRAVETGKTNFGFRQAERCVLKGDGKLVIVSQNAPASRQERLRHLAGLSNIPVYGFSGSALQLGSVCGKPFSISVMLVRDAGKSRVQDLAKGD